MKISVAMCTYNGAKYIEEQLQSILEQSRPVDEIVICDDESIDDTIAIIRGIEVLSNVEIRVFRNDKSIGVRRNFEKAICGCEGDIIFLSDQDDVWRKDKVERIIEWFDCHPNKDVVFTDALLIDEKNNMFTKRTLFDVVSMTKKAQRFFDSGYAFELFLKNSRSTGATMAFKKSVVARIPSLFDDAGDKYHDELISIDAIQRDTLGYCTDHLINYRIHSSQECGLGNRIKNVVKSDNALAPYCWNIGILPYVKDETFKKRGTFLHQRRKMVMSHDIQLFSIMRAANLYRRYYHRWALYCIIRDIATSTKNSILQKIRPNGK